MIPTTSCDIILRPRHLGEALNRLATVSKNNTGTTAYAYDTKNRLTNLAAAGGSGATPANFSYAHTLDNAGHRTSVTEQSGRKASYAYDSVYRLTS